MRLRKIGKKGAAGGGVVAVVLLGVVFLSLFGFFGYKLVGQSAVGGQPVGGTDGTTSGGVTGVTVTDTTNSITLKLKAQDVEAEPAVNLQDLPSYCWYTDTPGSLIGPNTGELSSDSDTITTDGVAVGSDVTCIGFNNTYYGEAVSFENLNAPPPATTLKAHRIAGAVEPTFFDQNGDAMNVNLLGTRNASVVGSSSSYTYDRLKVKLNESNRMMRLAGIAIDTVTSTNVTRVEFNGFGRASGVEGSGSYGLTKGVLPQRLITAGYDYLYAFNDGAKPYIELRGQDYVETGGLTLFSGSGCSGQANNLPETVTLAFVDNNHFQSQSSATPNVIKSGMENDAPTPSDVGMGDVTRGLYCNGY